VRHGHGSFLTLEFGQPRLEVSEHTEKARVGRRRRRVVAVYGDWHLWVYCCHWFVFRDGERVGYSEGTDASIGRAVRTLDGQRLTGVAVNQLPGRSVFTFDLGATLHTRPYSAPRTDPLLEQWSLYEPGGTVLTLRGDGRCSRGPGDTPPEREVWEERVPLSLTG